MNIKSYAKVNLFLLVKPLKDLETLHNIKSCFYKCDNLFDEIQIEPNNLDHDKVEYFFDNKKTKIKNCLITKSLEILRKEGFLNKYYSIKVNKNIPLFSGLGGGSSNAATVIKYLLKNENKKYKINKKLIELLHPISSDMIFFLYDYQFAIVKDYGKKVRKIKKIKPLNIEFLFTGIECETKKVFKTFDTLNHKNLKRTSIKKELNKIKKNQYNLLVNDLLISCINTYPKISEIYNKINKDNQNYLLSGSGGTFFKIVEEN